MSLLTIDKLSLSFGRTPILKNLSFSMEKGEMLAIVGESGSGKSLTALSCLGLQPPNAILSGSIQFDGQEIIGAGDKTLRQIRGKRIGMIFQEPMTALNPLHTVGKQISEMWGCEDAKMRRKDLSSHIPTSPHLHILLDQVGLSHLK